MKELLALTVGDPEVVGFAPERGDFLKRSHVPIGNTHMLG